ncbi:hypothetical protein SI65_02422 [Aspergillus cristatus]|uniref:Uncharacterized protein n=1 Tax=Aspergillus cristatus TaxID=573508 RepID=A0A1E3BKZ4_ASPCR|nr:hypothetical protein SI65_02422 [Aspergillus cristatus]
MTTRPSLLSLLPLISLFFSVSVSAAYILELRADKNQQSSKNEKQQDDDCNSEPQIEWEGTTCTSEHKKVIVEEFQNAITMTEQVQSDLHKNGYNTIFAFAGLWLSI